jgi:RsiW-degrading membrane proteinase PrsW (M82 family)
MDLDFQAKAATAIAPVLILLLTLDRLDIFNLISLRVIALLVGAGGAIAAASFLVNWRLMDGFPIGFSRYTRYVAPIVEECLKAAPVIALFAANRLGFKLDSAIAGFAIGAGFSLIENGWYLRMLSDANYSAWMVRGFGTAIMHGGATALFAVISHEMTERQAEADAAHYRFNPLLFLPGLVLAIVVHSAFNHFPHQPLVAMALTLLLVPLTLFVTLARSERATHQWLKADYSAHRQALEAIRSGRFAESEAGRSLQSLASKFDAAIAADVFAYLELKTELVLRGEEIMLAVQDGQDVSVGPSEREKVDRLEALERRLGRGVIAAIAPRLGFSRNDLWELERPTLCASVLDLKFARSWDQPRERTSNPKRLVESVFPSVAYESEIRSTPAIMMGRISDS